MYYDKDGSPLEMMDWAIKFDQPEYKRIAETSLPDGKWISTVWLGLDHSFGGGPLLHLIAGGFKWFLELPKSCSPAI